MSKRNDKKIRERLALYEKENSVKYVPPIAPIKKNTFNVPDRGPGNIVAYFDGACEPINPGGNMGMGATIRFAGQSWFTYSDYIPADPQNTNNVAEYLAFESILDFMLKNRWINERITIFGDSQLVIEQMFGNWKMNGGYYVPIARRCIDKIQKLRTDGNRIVGIWIPRTQNQIADELSKAAMINNGVQFKIQPQYADCTR